jgi:hypothetical protein
MDQQSLRLYTKQKNNTMTKRISLKKVKEFLDKSYGFDIANSKRKREYTYARKVFCKIGKDLSYTYSSIGKELGCDHCNALFHNNTFKVVTDRDIDIYNECLSYINHHGFEYIDNLSSKIKEENKTELFKYQYEISKLKVTIDELNNKVKSLETDLEHYKRTKNVLKLFSGWTESQQHDFIENRLKPYSNMISKQNLMIA